MEKDTVHDFLFKYIPWTKRLAQQERAHIEKFEKNLKELEEKRNKKYCFGLINGPQYVGLIQFVNKVIKQSKQHLAHYEQREREYKEFALEEYSKSLNKKQAPTKMLES